MTAPSSQPSFQPSQFCLEQVSLRAGTQYLLHNISFAVQPGEQIAIVGASGAGKTSLLKLLNRLLEVTQGRISFEQQDIRQIPVMQLRRQITLVSQESKLLGMTVRQALIYPLVLRGLDQSTIEQRLQGCLEQLHLPREWLERTEVQLSVGQRQWVAMGRALIIQPKVLLLDEPTSALDAGRSEHLLQVLQTVHQQMSTTILMVNHQLELVEQFCDRLLYIHNGELRQDQPAEQVSWPTLKQTLIDEEERAAREWH